MTSNAAGVFLRKVKDLGATNDATVLVEVDAVALPRSPIQILLGDHATLGIGQVIDVQKGGCPK